MSLYGSNGNANTNIPKFTIISSIIDSNTMIMNTTPNAFVKNMVVGLYPVSNTLVKTGETHGVKDATSGWVLRRSYMGGVTNTNITAGGSLYSNNDLLQVTANACLNSSANVVTNSTGGIISFNNFTNNGGLFPNSAYVTVSISNTTGGTPNGTLFAATVALGGRSGRHTNETLISVPSMQVNSTTNSTAFPNV